MNCGRPLNNTTQSIQTNEYYNETWLTSIHLLVTSPYYVIFRCVSLLFRWHGIRFFVRSYSLVSIWKAQASKPTNIVAGKFSIECYWYVNIFEWPLCVWMYIYLCVSWNWMHWKGISVLALTIPHLYNGHFLPNL